MTTFIITVAIQACEMRPCVCSVRCYEQRIIRVIFLLSNVIDLYAVFFMAAARVKSPEQISHFWTSVTDRPSVKAHHFEVDASFSSDVG